MRLSLLTTVLCFLSFTGLREAPALDFPSITVVIENAGPSDRPVIPLIISTSEKGLSAGRNLVFQDIGAHMVQTHIVPEQLIAKLVDSLRLKDADKPDSLRSFGTLQFAVIKQAKVERAIILNRSNSMQTLQDFSHIAGQGELEKELTDMRDQVAALPK